MNKIFYALEKNLRDKKRYFREIINKEFGENMNVVVFVSLNIPFNRRYRFEVSRNAFWYCLGKTKEIPIREIIVRLF